MGAVQLVQVESDTDTASDSDGTRSDDRFVAWVVVWVGLVRGAVICGAVRCGAICGLVCGLGWVGFCLVWVCLALGNWGMFPGSLAAVGWVVVAFFHLVY